MKDLFINAATGEITEIETSKESIAEMKAFQEKLATDAANSANAKSAALAKLEALGLTVDELTALGL